MNKQNKKARRSQRINHEIESQLLTKQIQIKFNFNLNESISQTLFPHLPTQKNQLQLKAMAIYKEYLRLFEMNQKLNQKIIKQVQDRNHYAAQYNDYKACRNDQIIKRKRRQATQIKRMYYCPISKCRKQYGSQGSLTHHVRLKHLQFYSSGKFQLFIDNYIKQLRSKEELSKMTGQKDINQVEKMYYKNSNISWNQK